MADARPKRSPLPDESEPYAKFTPVYLMAVNDGSARSTIRYPCRAVTSSVPLQDTADDVMLPKIEYRLTEWQAALACLINAAEGRDFLMHARTATLRALNRPSSACSTGKACIGDAPNWQGTDERLGEQKRTAPPDRI
jgi:hypothetical protein